MFHAALFLWKSDKKHARERLSLSDKPWPLWHDRIYLTRKPKKKIHSFKKNSQLDPAESSVLSVLTFPRSLGSLCHCVRDHRNVCSSQPVQRPLCPATCARVDITQQPEDAFLSSGRLEMNWSRPPKVSYNPMKYGVEIQPPTSLSLSLAWRSCKAERFQQWIVTEGCFPPQMLHLST